MKSRLPTMVKEPAAGWGPGEKYCLQKTLWESEEFSTSLLDGMPNPIFVVNTDTSIRYVNPAFEKLTGFSFTDLLGVKQPHPWWPEEKIPAISAALKKTRPESNFKMEATCRKKNGELFWIESNASRITKNGETYVLVSWNDITERKKAEELITKANTEMESFINNISDMAWLKDVDSNFIMVNKTFCDIVGMAPEYLKNHTCEVCFGAEAAVKFRKDDRKVMEGRRQIVFEESILDAKGNEVFLETIKSPILDASGNVAGTVGVARNITGRKQMEAALRESQEFNYCLLENAPNPIEVVNLDMSTKYVNKAFEELTGFTSAEVVGGKPPYLWVPEEITGETAEVISKDLTDTIENATADVKINRKEILFQNKKGERMWAEVSIVPVKHDGATKYHLVNWVDITARKRMEQAKRDSEEKYTKAFLASPDAIAISTIEEGRFIEVNESFVKIFGHSREEAIGHTSHELKLWSPPEERARMLAVLKEQGSIHNELFSFRTKSGETKMIMFSAELITLGDKPYMISTSVDVTRQTIAEERLRLLGSVTQQVTDSIIITDLEHRITYMNKAAQDLYGYTTDEMLGIEVGTLNAVPSDRLRQTILSELVQGRTWSGMLVKRRKDGGTFLCDCRQSPLYNEHGRISSYIIVHRDITEQKKIEARLKGQKQLIESILSSLPEGVLVTDSSDRIVLVNEAFRRIFQTGKKAIENRLLSETLHVGQLTKLYREMKEDGILNNSLEFRYKVGKQEKVISSVIIKMEGGRVLLIFVDVSREREEEDKLYLMDRLASLGEMAAGLAHELNNPLTGILTLSQLLVNSDVPEQQKEDLHCIYSEAKRAASIVKNVLLFTRNNSYENGQSSVNEVVKEVLRLREHQACTSNIEVVTNLREDLPEVPLDKYQMQQVFLNIILNAEAAMKETGRPGVLTVTTERVNHHVNIIFSDTGCGIKKDVLPRIFDPFFTTKEIGKGTGLGLSICYGIIIKHNGKISVKTGVGKGTTFTVRLPVAEQ